MAMFNFNTGKKSNFNHYFNKGSFKGKSYEEIMLQQTIEHEMGEKFCRYCGKDINAESYPHLTNEELKWQRDNDAHISCHQRYLYSQRGV